MVLLNVLQFLVRSMFYVFITWHRFVPDRSGRRSDGTSGQAKRGA